MPWKHAVILVLAAAAAGCSKKTEEPAPVVAAEWPKNGLTEAQANEVLAKVGDRTITVGEFADRLASQSPYLRARFESPERRKEFLDNLVRFELLVYEAKRRGYADEPEVVRARRNAMIQQLVKKEVDEPLEDPGVSDAEVEAAYQTNPTEFDRPAQRRASHIFVLDQHAARKVLAAAKKTDLAGFRKMAREQSEDEKTAKQGGDLGFFTAEEDDSPPKAVVDAAFTLEKVGSVYPELVAEGGGFHVVLLTGKRAELKRTYEQAKRAIRHKLTRERKNEAMGALTKRLREDIEVEIDYDALADVRIDMPAIPENSQ